MLTEIVILAVLLLVGLIPIYVKLRKVHIAVLEIRDITATALKETTSAFTQERWLELLTHRLGFQRPLPPTRGWAGSPDFLEQVAAAVADERPAVVVECSSGVSTLVIARMLQQAGAGHVYSLEHDADYAERTRQLLREYKVDAWATVFHAPLVSRPGFTPWYDDAVLPADLPPVNLLVVDGPPTSVAPLARYPALPILKDRLQNGFTAFVDDADRTDEREMLRRWQLDLPGLQVEFRNCEKGLGVARKSAQH